MNSRQTHLTMTLRYYDCLEKLTKELDQLETNKAVTKQDVTALVRSRLVQLMKHIIITPTIGVEYAYPGDIDLTPWTDDHLTQLDVAASS